ncbi:hypothetical protein GALMADRAFT_160094 [Galerina marginata CBS 339.88]|uniref:Uncharacterized protein n=1 Tax=Galerina marginata (strain CBS 339.88) TaxID=685588 RepID=A0A067SU48_GALM3|nr:hypothetical protein GALMADRAFT_160094 [Galerina marginata CBS 339.88]
MYAHAWARRRGGEENNSQLGCCWYPRCVFEVASRGRCSRCRYPSPSPGPADEAADAAATVPPPPPAIAVPVLLFSTARVGFVCVLQARWSGVHAGLNSRAPRVELSEVGGVGMESGEGGERNSRFVSTSSETSAKCSSIDGLAGPLEPANHIGHRIRRTSDQQPSKPFDLAPNHHHDLPLLLVSPFKTSIKCLRLYRVEQTSCRVASPPSFEGRGPTFQGFWMGSGDDGLQGETLERETRLIVAPPSTIATPPSLSTPMPTCLNHHLPTPQPPFSPCEAIATGRKACCRGGDGVREGGDIVVSVPRTLPPLLLHCRHWPLTQKPTHLGHYLPRHLPISPPYDPSGRAAAGRAASSPTRGLQGIREQYRVTGTAPALC